MLWFFEKEEARLHYEIRREPDGQRIELVITWPDGREQVEAYDDPADVLARSEILQRRFAETGWQAPATRARFRSRGFVEQ
jgi:hypothetical protein